MPSSTIFAGLEDTWIAGSRGIDAAAIEHMDRRSLEILRRTGPIGNTRSAFLRHGAGAPRAARAAAGHDGGRRLRPDQTLSSAIDGPFARFCRLLNEHGLFDDTELALPGDRHRAEQLIAVREAVPAGVNQRVGRAQREIDPRIAKTAADMIVPFDRFGEMMAIYRDGFRVARARLRGLGTHLRRQRPSQRAAAIVRGRRAREGGDPGIRPRGRRLGGCPLAEHGVGRNPVKQALLRGLYGDEGIAEMRAVKRALDPDWKLAPGVIFPR